MDGHKSVVSVGAALHDRRGANGGVYRRDSTQRDKPKEQEKNSSHQRERGRSGTGVAGAMQRWRLGVD